MNKPDDCLADCHCLLQVLEEEYKGSAGALITRLYYDAFQISITHGDEGEDSLETREIKNLMENPAGHRNFGASQRWKTAKGLVPKGLGTGGLEKWLWRQGR
jgi:hypothetical protein